MWYYIRALAESGAEQRSLKTEQETSIQKNRKQRTSSSFIKSQSNGEFDPGSG